MPKRENMSAKVTLIIEVDGHRLTFEEDIRQIAGARYHGVDPDPANLGFTTKDTLEHDLRRRVAAAIRVQAGRCEEFLRRAYPIHTDREDST